jgi:hypothetical protein
MVMFQNHRKISDNALVIAGLMFMNVIILNAALTENQEHYKVLLLSVPLSIIFLFTRAMK